MPKSELVVPSAATPGASGCVVEVTPASAGWRYVGFQAYRLKPGERLESETGSDECCLVLLSGKADIRTSAQRWDDVGERMSVFEPKPPYSAYVPSGDRFGVEALTEVELAVCRAPGKGTYPARLIVPADVGVEIRGQGLTERIVRNILPEGEPADSLLVVEVYTPGGHWSSYPPHKHDEDRLPDESLLEETYYHRIEPAHGFAVQRVYTDDRSLDETITVRDGDVVLVPRGYHPVGAPAGYDVYYLNVMAGPVRTWKFHNDPDHEWIMQGWSRPVAAGGKNGGDSR
ncbi:5-deoxy-glucuronate isomerase [Paenibacillus cisolokensis]|uniref:5-deoxy-glucuronate isomerase n=1 Tax=Paenibacillus cisolokensis TaxID=1658519 RepID=A0ABQ4NE90_9BACL|nr:5-deoxy-glucuronate isomerase [Paenibacillus cisolokensis]GIQ66557.1 5-deoxy-glucuronate isomerase [Paenibacillus cisolokensis]